MSIVIYNSDVEKDTPCAALATCDSLSESLSATSQVFNTMLKRQYKNSTESSMEGAVPDCGQQKSYSLPIG